MNDLSTRRLTRRTDDKLISGVCAGVGEYLGVDPTIVRVIAVVTGVMFFPVVPIAYVAAWALMPRP